MKYIQFYHLSTGYVEGSIPPRYEESAKRPIEAVGSENVIKLDGRLGLAQCTLIADSLMTSPRYHRAVGYQLMQSRRHFTDGKPWGPYHPR